MEKREIKFRGYATGIGWVYGSLVNNLWTYSELSQYEKGSACCEIITGKYEGYGWEDIAQQEGEAIVSVVPDSVGEFTGFKDKNGIEIYEGDIVKIEKIDGAIYNAQIRFFKGAFCIHTNTDINENIEGHNVMMHIDFDWKDQQPFYEIIGNAYENAEL